MTKIQNSKCPPPPYSSPSLREGEDIGGGGVFLLNFKHLNFEFTCPPKFCETKLGRVKDL